MILSRLVPTGIGRRWCSSGSVPAPWAYVCSATAPSGHTGPLLVVDIDGGGTDLAQLAAHPEHRCSRDDSIDPYPAVQPGRLRPPLPSGRGAVRHLQHWQAGLVPASAKDSGAPRLEIEDRAYDHLLRFRRTFQGDSPAGAPTRPLLNATAGQCHYEPTSSANASRLASSRRSSRSRARSVPTAVTSTRV